MTTVNREKQPVTINLDTVCHFTWGFGHSFLLEPAGQTGKWEKRQFFVWSDPGYQGDNTIKKYRGNPRHFTMKNFCGRDKGNHTVRGYCGEEVVFQLDQEVVDR